MKKQYISPKMDIVDMEPGVSLLAGSGSEPDNPYWTPPAEKVGCDTPWWCP